jgi:hypothetical protein
MRNCEGDQGQHYDSIVVMCAISQGKGAEPDRRTLTMFATGLETPLATPIRDAARYEILNWMGGFEGSD